MLSISPRCSRRSDAPQAPALETLESYRARYGPNASRRRRYAWDRVAEADVAPQLLPARRFCLARDGPATVPAARSGYFSGAAAIAWAISVSHRTAV